MARKKKTKNQIEFQKQVKRIKSLIRRAEKRGFYFLEKPQLEKPKRITKKVIEKLQQIKPITLYKKSRYTDPISGETMSGTEGLKYRRSVAQKKRKQIELNYVQIVKTRIEEMKRLVYPFFDLTQQIEMLIKIVDDNDNIVDDYSKYLMENEFQISSLINVIQTDSKLQSVQSSFTNLAFLLNANEWSDRLAADLAESFEAW